MENDSRHYYFTAIPNPGAGIGHQLANWIAGYWFAQQFGLQFAHIPFSSNKWEDFLGFGDGEISVQELCKHKGYKKVRLPLFNENKTEEVALIKSIIASYSNQKVVFVCEQDQFYRNQFGIQESIQQKFVASKARENEKIIYSKENYNIAIHVRRGDIVVGQTNNNPNLVMRWQNNDYFVNVLSNVLNQIETDKHIAIYLFSQGVEADFPEFKKFENITFCLDMNAQDSFAHMVFADVLITSKSSFSYKPALLNKGIKVCPKDFWHGYPKTEDWILADENGQLIKK
ncbi:MAG: hypothetical protein KBE41_04415 [Lutibacter sp.]|nr:hypothetical protein [Lutibacter sp.]MBP9600726.1 hypothetical protein [Lutibacter sp.]